MNTLLQNNMNQPQSFDFDDMMQFSQRKMLTMESEIRQTVLMADKMDATALVDVAANHGSAILEAATGVGKTMVAKTLATVIGGTFARAQGTPDMMPQDITGSYFYNQETGLLEFQPGPIFRDVLLVDEIRKISPKTQAAFLEAMEEGQVTSRGVTRPTGNKVTVATANPGELTQASFPLPVANLDRFTIGIQIPDMSATNMVDALSINHVPAQILKAGELEQIHRTVTGGVAVSRETMQDMAEIIEAIREDKSVEKDLTALWGVRALKSAIAMAKGFALMDGQPEVNANDALWGLKYAIPHRIGLTAQAEQQQKTSQMIVNRFVQPDAYYRRARLITPQTNA